MLRAIRPRSSPTTRRSRCISVDAAYGLGSASTAASSPREAMPVSASALSRSVFEGSVPVLVQAPPRWGAAFSIIAVRLPKYAACAAPFSPAGPLPITIKSYIAMSTNVAHRLIGDTFGGHPWGTPTRFRAHSFWGGGGAQRRQPVQGAPPPVP